jgi:uncharacterized protein YijF (DUF1287 family)
LSDVTAGTWATAVEFGLQIGGAQRQIGRTAVYDAAYAHAVTFAK